MADPIATLNEYREHYRRSKEEIHELRCALSDEVVADAGELARIISHEAGYDFDSAGPTLQSRFSKAADAIIAAGYSKKRRTKD